MNQLSSFGELTSEELAGRALAGSDDCFAELVQRHTAALFAFLCRKVRSVQDAEDLTQETFARAHQRLHLYDPTYKFKSWLFTIGARLSYSHYRKTRDDAVALPVEPASNASPLDSLAETEERSNLWTEIRDLLPPAQFTCLWLRYGQALSIREISQQTRRSEVSVKVSLHRARTKLAKTLTTRRPS